MRINSDFPIQQPRGANAQKNTAERAAGEAEVRDVLAIESKDPGVRAADSGVRESQDAMTLFRITGDSLAKIEDTLVSMSGVADRAAVGDEGLEKLQLEVDDLAEFVRFATGNTTMGGVPVFGESAETAAMWSATVQNVSALSPDDDNELITGVADTSLEALGLGGLNVGTRGAALDASAKIEAAIARVSGDRETMTAQADRMGDLAMSSIARFSAGSRITDSNTAAGLMAFVRLGIGASPDAAVSAQTWQGSFDLAKINA